VKSATTKCKKIVISLISNTYKKKLHKQKINNENKMDLEEYEKIKTLEGFNKECQKHLQQL
jgi:hypothetical protein